MCIHVRLEEVYGFLEHVRLLTLAFILLEASRWLQEGSRRRVAGKAEVEIRVSDVLWCLKLCICRDKNINNRKSRLHLGPCSIKRHSY